MAENRPKFEVSHINIRQSISILIIRIIVLEIITVSLLILSCGLFACLVTPFFYQVTTIIFSLFKITIVIYMILQWLTEYHEITHDMIIHRRGIIFIKQIKFPFEYVREVDYEQSYLGKILNYGSINLFNWQTKQFHTMYMIHNPKRYLAIIKKLIPKTEEHRQVVR